MLPVLEIAPLTFCMPSNGRPQKVRAVASFVAEEALPESVPVKPLSDLQPLTVVNS